MIKNALRVAPLPLFVLWFAGCSSSNGSTGSGGSGGNGGGGGGAQGTIFGDLNLKTFEADRYATLSGQFVDAPKPHTMPLKIGMKQSGCELLTPVTCDPACPITSYCSNAGQCVVKPNPVSAGTLTVSGLAGITDPLDPTGPLYAYSGPTLQQPYPPCAEGSSFSIQSDKLTVSSKCIAPFVLTNTLPIPVKSGMATHLTWTPPAAGATSRVQISLEISHHGGYKGQIDCEVPDTGSFDMPEPLITALIALGRAGYPSIDVQRIATGAAPNEPNAHLNAVSGVLVDVDTGVVSCMASTDCPTGMTCQVPGAHICQ